MNPLFLLFGFFGTFLSGAASSLGSSNAGNGKGISGPKDPVAETPIVDPPVEEPVAVDPVVDPPVEEPVAEDPVVDPPVEEPVAEDPVVDPPVEEPVAEDPVVDPPVEEPVAEDPVVDPPVEEPVAEDPVVDPPVEEPVAEDPVVDPPVEEPVAEDPVVDPPVEEPVAEDPVVDPPVEDPAVDPTPTAPEQTGGTGEDGGSTEALVADNSVSVIAGRVSTLAANGDDVASVRILNGVDNGNVTVNADNTMALVMTQSDFTGNQSYSYEMTHTDGSTSTQTVNLNVTPGLQDLGWATGESHYMLATDEDDRVIVETGDNHHKVHISGSNEAYSLADIAQAEGMSTSQVTGDWLANSAYGQSEGMALDETAGMLLWNTVTPRGSETSNWLLLERGHEYGDLGRILNRDTHGEDETHPLHIGAFGEGELPEITTEFNQFQESSSNVVVQDIHFSDGIWFTGAQNFVFDGIKTTGGESVIQLSDGITIRNSQFLDATPDAPTNGGNEWSLYDDRMQGLLMGRGEGLLLEGNLFDHNGWGEGYNDAQSSDGGAGLPPSMWSHNIYIAENMTDVTMRDTISMRASSFGAQIRAGGFMEDNLFLDNNAGLAFVGGNYKDAGYIGHYTLATDNLITSAAHHDSAIIGALAQGVTDRGQLTSMVDNIVTHLADPNGNEDWKVWTHDPQENANESYYNDTIVYNWEGSRNVFGDPWPEEENTEGLDSGALDATTIQLFTAQLLGDDNATIADLADYLRGQADGAFDGVVDADLIIRFFQEGFGIETDLRDTTETLRFEPDDLGDGIRWDNRLNWDTDDLPGLFATDSVDLAGNHVVFGTNATIDELGFGSGGELNVYGGRLTANGGMTAGNDGGLLHLEGAGQAWIDGSDGSDIDVEVDSGRFVNTGDMSGVNLTATGGETILATDGAEFDVSASKTLAVFAEAAKVGFDGEDGGIAILDMEEGSTVAFAANDGDLGTIEEFRSGAFGDNPNVQSGIDLGEATLSIDLSGLSAAAGSTFTLMNSDELVGLFGDTDISGLGGRDARIVVDYENDSVTLELSSGNGSVSVDTIGAQTDVSSGQQALWDALTSGQDTLSETAMAQVPDDEDDLLDAA